MIYFLFHPEGRLYSLLSTLKAHMRVLERLANLSVEFHQGIPEEIRLQPPDCLLSYGGLSASFADISSFNLLYAQLCQKSQSREERLSNTVVETTFFIYKLQITVQINEIWAFDKF